MNTALWDNTNASALPSKHFLKQQKEFSKDCSKSLKKYVEEEEQQQENQ